MKALNSLKSFILACSGLSGGLLLLTGASLGGKALAADVKCTAKVALNQTYMVEIAEEGGATVITNASGSRFDGTSNRSISGRTGDITWFLGTGFGKGFEVSVENGGQNRTAFCLAANECYLCR